eukprot:442036_1
MYLTTKSSFASMSHFHRHVNHNHNHNSEPPLKRHKQNDGCVSVSDQPQNSIQDNLLDTIVSFTNVGAEEQQISNIVQNFANEALNYTSKFDKWTKQGEKAQRVFDYHSNQHSSKSFTFFLCEEIDKLLQKQNCSDLASTFSVDSDAGMNNEIATSKINALQVWMRRRTSWLHYEQIGIIEWNRMPEHTKCKTIGMDKLMKEFKKYVIENNLCNCKLYCTQKILPSQTFSESESDTDSNESHILTGQSQSINQSTYQFTDLTENDDNTDFTAWSNQKVPKIIQKKRKKTQNTSKQQNKNTSKSNKSKNNNPQIQLSLSDTCSVDSSSECDLNSIDWRSTNWKYWKRLFQSALKTIGENENHN